MGGTGAPLRGTGRLTTTRRDQARSRCRFPAPGVAVECGVSGGPDSLALLVLAVDAGLDVTAVHVDHGLRPGSADEADIVAAAAAHVGAAFQARQAIVAPGPDLEARAREARHRSLSPDALLGHTADDQAETVLLALLRGAGLDGIAAMGDRRHPILALRRVDTEAICAEVGLDPIRDPMNEDRRFRRNRIRHEALPLLGDIAERDAVPLLARTARLAADERDLLDALAADLDPTDARALRDAPVALARRAVRTWLRERAPDRHPPDAAGVERVLAVARGECVATQVCGGIEIRRSGQRLTSSVAPSGR